MEHRIRSDREVIPQQASGADEICMDPLLIPRDFDILSFSEKLSMIITFKKQTLMFLYTVVSVQV